MLGALIDRICENGDRFFECLLLTFTGVGVVEQPPVTWRMASLSSQLQAKKSSHPTSTGRPSNFYWCFIGKFLPFTSIVVTVDRILEQYRDTTASAWHDHATCRLVTHLMRQLRDRVELSIDDISLMSRHAMVVLAAWMSLDISLLIDKVLVELVSELEDSLCWSLSKAFSSLALLSYDYASIMQRFFEVKVATSKWCTSPQKCLLTVVVSSDCTKCCEAFFKVYSTVKNSNGYQQIFKGGILDASMSAMLNCDENKTSHRDEILSIISDVNGRLSALCLDSNIASHEMNTLLPLTMRLINVEIEFEQNMLNTNILADILSQQLIRSGQALTSTPRQELESEMQQFIEAALYICLHCKTGSESISALSSFLFLYLCDLIVLTSSHQKMNASRVANDNITSSQVQQITWMKQLISGEFLFDLDAVNKNGFAKLVALVRACLRNGMRVEGNDTIKIRSLYLELVNLMIKIARSDNCRQRPIGTTGSTTQDQSISSLVFSMVTTHSKFDVLMSSVENKGVQVEISRVLFTCISRATDIKFAMATWSLLLSFFDAGIDDKDLLLRSVLFEYSRLAKKVRENQTHKCRFCKTPLRCSLSCRIRKQYILISYDGVILLDEITRRIVGNG